MRIKDLFLIRKGKKATESTLENLRYIQIEDLRNDDNLKYAAKNNNNVICYENDILIAWDGANAGTIGYGLEGAVGSTLAILRKKTENVFTPYAGRFLQSKFKFLRDNCTGATIPHISRPSLENLLIPLPPLPVQRRIAAILDAADEHRRKTEALIEKYDELAQSVFLEMFGDPVRNEKGWEAVKLEDLGVWRSGGTPPRNVKRYYKNGLFPWYTSGELNKIYISKSVESITEEAINNSSTKLIEEGSLLLGMYDTAALKSSITTQISTCNQAIAFSKLNDQISNTIFIYTYIQIGKEWLRKEQRGVRQKNLSLSMIKELNINLPPLDLQNQFADRFKKIELQKRHAQEAARYSVDLFQSLLQRAFKGELVTEEEMVK